MVFRWSENTKVSKPAPTRTRSTKGVKWFLEHRSLLYQIGSVDSVVVPATNCYVLDNSSHVYDFSNWNGHLFEYDGGVMSLILMVVSTDCAIRFCKDVETRSQSGYVCFGKFEGFNYFVAGSERYNFVQVSGI
ncbi:hypothetical protein HanXRQr2_Chr16g0725081 [Helianthus annuus]|uniref:Uncharacterized protein n=1 Tax=Helianthus annuus TaxID=4232 RepID=A0A9K3GWJ9_HELAN|nr:hypothetical protein HanXRQr2_Chr16g0725081 [Helianthus annuus]